jgi:hypothetical protein
MPAKSRKKNTRKEMKPMLFTPLNFKLMGLGVFLIVLGFAVMRIENEVYGFISLYISPVVILSGYLIVIVAILKKDHKTESNLTD